MRSLLKALGVSMIALQQETVRMKIAPQYGRKAKPAETRISTTQEHDDDA